MDRRNLWSVAARGAGGSFLTGTLAARPGPGTPGRVYVVSPVVAIATSVGGTALAAAQQDSGSEWITPASRVFINTAPLTLTATGVFETQRSLLKVSLKPNIMGTKGSVRVHVYGALTNLATAGGAITFTYRFKYSTTTQVTSGALNLVTGNTAARTHIVAEMVANNATNAQLAHMTRVIPQSGTPGMTHGSAAIDSTVSQVLDLTVAFGRQVVNPAKAFMTVNYVALDWLP